MISMTSGALLPMWIFEKIGWFASEYFIDCVDFEYCFRIRAAGCLVADAKECGTASRKWSGKQEQFTFRIQFRPTHYNAARRYYISRNRIALYRKYFRVFPRWILQSMYDSSRETIKCFVSEQERLPKFRSFMLGTWDGLTAGWGSATVGSEAN